jgi:uncharacterized repeat protein (TIGR03803 family)
LRTLHTFSAADGAAPVGALVEGPDGSFYGITTRGGVIEGSNRPRSGTVFKITPSGSYSTLYVFSSGPEGGEPTGLLLGADGNLYGATRDGGALHGTIFRITPAGALTTLHTFNGTDGSQPIALVQDRAGVLYGTTLSGSMFKTTIKGEFSTVSMSGVNDCGNAGLTLGGDDFFYATCASGGAAFSGEIIKLSTNGSAVQLYAFTGPDGRFPRSPLSLGGDGNFYGMTTAGGLNGLGTLFKITPQGKMTIIRQLSLADGVNGISTPATFLRLGNGDLLGAGPSSIFELTPDGKITELYKLNNFNGEGMSPNTFVQGRDGRFYATTNKGGTVGMGTVFHLAFPKAGDPTGPVSVAGAEGQHTAAPGSLMKLDAWHTPGRAPGKFYLGGIWVVHARQASGQIVDSQYKFVQEDDEFNFCFKVNEKETCYVGDYVAHSSSIVLRPGSVPTANYNAQQSTLTVRDPDHVESHIRAEGRETVIYYERLSAPESDDAACDPQNSSHTIANFAFERARAAYHHNDAAAAACWNHAAAVQGYARSRGLLSAVLEVGEGVAPDYAASLAWATKAAEQGDFLGQIVLSRLYHFGHGVPADEAKSTVWREKGIAGYRAYLQSIQGKGSPWDRLSPAQRNKVVRLTSAILDTWAGMSQESAMMEEAKREHPGISDDSARSMLASDPDYQDARNMTSSGFGTQLKMILGVDSSDDEIRKELESRK